MNLQELTQIFSDFQAEYGVPPRTLYLASREWEELRAEILLGYVSRGMNASEHIRNVYGADVVICDENAHRTHLRRMLVGRTNITRTANPIARADSFLCEARIPYIDETISRIVCVPNWDSPFSLLEVNDRLVDALIDAIEEDYPDWHERMCRIRAEQWRQEQRDRERMLSESFGTFSNGITFHSGGVERMRVTGQGTWIAGTNVPGSITSGINPSQLNSSMTGMYPHRVWFGEASAFTTDGLRITRTVGPALDREASLSDPREAAQLLGANEPPPAASETGLSDHLDAARYNHGPSLTDLLESPLTGEP